MNFYHKAIGLKDINGLMVREGDTLQFAGTPDGIKYTVRWTAEKAAYEVWDDEVKFCLGTAALVSFMIIIGSRYQERKIWLDNRLAN